MALPSCDVVDAEEQGVVAGGARHAAGRVEGVVGGVDVEAGPHTQYNPARPVQVRNVVMPQ